ncbi:hypothetical protein EZV62_024459 [Acer yangbiense]|uniref:CCHC-type domain-containing protein n=1 Tax=Acer yangbiense TaxID=1000413 RepID=A0A5C7GUW8_9ROSI|nr:hypothetical protein EZV62_024459 [Acer yangbiense]
MGPEMACLGLVVLAMNCSLALWKNAYFPFGSNMDMSHGMFTNGTGHLDLNNEGHSRWHEVDTTQTDNEEYNPNDTYNNNEWPFHVSFEHGNVSTAAVMSDDNLVQLADDLLHSELINLQVRDIIGKEFIYVTDAEEFYKKYSYGMGFSMHKDRLCRDTHGLITIRRWVCSKEGHRSKKHVDKTDRVREPKWQTREGCRASLKINLDREKMLWGVTKFVTEHSHKLIGMKTSQVIDQLLDQCGSYAVVGHTRKDLQNWLNTIRRSASHNSDADSIISYMTAKSEMDPSFFFQYTILEDGSMVTDGDKAMSEAISSVMPSTVCRLCSWHLQRNVQMNVGRNLLMNHSNPSITTGKTCCRVYTRNTFAWVRDEIKSEAKLSIVNCVDDMESVMYTFKKFVGGDKTWNVSVIKAMNQHHIPETLIMKRWIMNAKDVSKVESSSTATTPNIMQIARYGALSLKCNKMSYYASMSTKGYKEANVAIDKLTIQMKGLLTLSSTAREENVHRTRIQSSVQVKDPDKATINGSMRQNKNSSGKARKCGKCGQPGHTKKTCRAHVNNNISAMASNGAARTRSILQPIAYTDLVQSCDSEYVVDSDGRCQAFAFQKTEVPMATFSNQLNDEVFSMTSSTPTMYMQQNS